MVIKNANRTILKLILLNIILLSIYIQISGLSNSMNNDLNYIDILTCGMPKCFWASLRPKRQLLALWCDLSKSYLGHDPGHRASSRAHSVIPSLQLVV